MDERRGEEVMEHPLKSKGSGEPDSGAACEMLINKTIREREREREREL